MSDEVKSTNDVGAGVGARQDIALQGGLDQTALFIQNADHVFQPCVLDGVTWETERKGAPGKLTFKVVKDETLDFTEGNLVKFGHNGKEVFKGYIFTKKRNKDGIISVTAYDQLRYLKNKDIYNIVGIKASDLIKQIAEDFKLTLGEIEDTKYVIAKMRASNETLMDIIQKALDHTLAYSEPDPQTGLKKLYVLYDEYGKLMLKDIASMQLDILIDAETAEDFDYQSSIDKDVYNRIKLYHDNKKTGKREVYLSLDSGNIARWGTLQLCESVNPKQCTNPAAKADTLLKLHNRVRRALSIKNALGDDRVRGGSMIYVRLNLGDMELGGTAEDGQMTVQPMLVESAKHKFTNNQHTMDLQLRGDVIG